MDGLAIFKVNEEDKIEFPEVHINYWVLPGVFWRERCYLDIGVFIKRTEGSPDGFRLALPFKFSKDEFCDLNKKLESSSTLRLVFGGIAKWNDPYIHFPEGTKFSSQLRDVKLTSINVVNNDQDGQNIIDLKINPNCKEDNLYCRFRVLGHLDKKPWCSLNKGLSITRREFDFKFSDKRSFPESDTISDNAFPKIKKLNLHLIVTSAYEPTRLTTAVAYSRTLEGHGWEDYLSRDFKKKLKKKFVVYKWAFDSVDIDDPVRLYSVFRYQKGVTWIMILFSLLLSLGIALLATFFSSPDGTAVVEMLYNTTKNIINEFWVYIIGSGLTIAGLLGIGSRINKLKKTAAKIKTLLNGLVDRIDQIKWSDSNFKRYVN